MKTKTYILSLLFFSIFFIGTSQDGTLDTSFGNNGFVFTDFNENTDIIYNVGQTFDEKLLVIGIIDENVNAVIIISRYLINGDVDLTFGNNGVLYPSYNINPYSKSELVIQPDNSFFVTGTENESFITAKHLSNGDLDTSFGNNGFMITNVDEDNFHKTVLQLDGKIITVGRTKDAANYYQIMMVRHLANGDLDPTFGNNGIALIDTGGDFFRTRKVVLQSDGKILLQITDYINTPKKLVAYRFMPNGNLDNTFGNLGKIIILEEDALTGGSMTLKPDGKIIATASNMDTGITKIIQYLPNGTVDVTFADNGEKIINHTDFYTSKVFFKGNRIVIYGHISEFEGTTLALLRLTENGAVDSNFGTNGYSYSSVFQSNDVLIQTDDKILVVGSTYWYEGESDFALTRFENTFLGTSNQYLKSVSVFPNPSKGIFKISHSFITSKTAYQISEITGKLIQKGNLTGKQTQVNISQFENGIYLFTSEGSTVRLIKN